MRTTEAFFSFLAFLICFLGALTARFYHAVYLDRESSSYFFMLVILLILSSIFMGMTARNLSVRKRNHRWAAFLGFTLVAPLFLGISKFETVMSQNLLSSQSDPSYFPDINGHCGVYAGRALIRAFDLNFKSPAEVAFKNFEMGMRCRLRHFVFLEKEKKLGCKDGEREIECRIRWMQSFSEKGYWNFQTRKFFFENVREQWELNRKDEDLVNYALKDQELEMSRQGILKQVGLDEGVSVQPMLISQRDELSHLELTIKIFDQVAEAVHDFKGVPSPELLKFRDLNQELQQKRTKVSEIKQNIQQLEKGAQGGT